MKILGLAGVKAATLDWMQLLLAALDDESFEAEIHHYRHWSDAGEADVDFEAAALANRAPDLVIAKSLGTCIAVHAFAHSGFRPRKAVFIGTPLGRHGADDYARLAGFTASVPTLFIQQTDDFNGSCKALRSAVEAFANARVAEVAGDDHVYRDITELINLVRPFLAAKL